MASAVPKSLQRYIPEKMNIHSYVITVTSVVTREECEHQNHSMLHLVSYVMNTRVSVRYNR